jgi:acyl-coenzyme A thioesterase PaaI-like protein
VVDFEAGQQHANPMGTLHGGVLCDIADAVWKARLRATGHVVKTGRTVGLVECDIVDDGGSLVARASSTCLTLRGDGAQGR